MAGGRKGLHDATFIDTPGLHQDVRPGCGRRCARAGVCDHGRTRPCSAPTTASASASSASASAARSSSAAPRPSRTRASSRSPTRTTRTSSARASSSAPTSAPAATTGGCSTTRTCRRCIIAVPDHWHKQMALDAMAAGKDVYIEKPMTHRWEDGDAIIDAARKQKRIVQVGSQWASVEANAQAIDIIKSGKLGQVTLIDGRMHRNTPTGAWYYPVPPDASPETIDWARFIGPAPQRPFDAAPLLPVAPVLGLLGRPADRPLRPHDHRDPHAHGREDGQPRHGDGRHPHSSRTAKCPTRCRPSSSTRTSRSR